MQQIKIGTFSARIHGLKNSVTSIVKSTLRRNFFAQLILIPYYSTLVNITLVREREMKNILRKLGFAVLLTFFFTNSYAGGGNNHAAIFLGVTSSSDYTDETAAVEYEYLLPGMDKQFGIGLVGEGIFGSPKALVYVAGLVYHPKQLPGFKVNFSLGGESKNSFDKNYFLTRVGAAYDFHYNNISYGPVYNLDYVNSKTFHVLGIAVGVGF